MACPQKENGHLDLANEIVEAMAKIQLSGYESRILWAVWRRTYCWHKKEEVIKFDYFRESTGLVDSHISRTIKRLVDRNILTKNGNKYSFQKDYQKWQVELPKLVSVVTKNGKSTYQKSASDACAKETIKRNLLKETIKRKGAKAPLEVLEIMNFFKETYGIKTLPDQLRNLGAARWLFNEKGLDKTKQAIIAAWSCRGQEFAPSINNLLDLRSKYGKLEEHYYRQQQSSKKPSIIG